MTYVNMRFGSKGRLFDIVVRQLHRIDCTKAVPINLLLPQIDTFRNVSVLLGEAIKRLETDMLLSN